LELFDLSAAAGARTPVIPAVGAFFHARALAAWISMPLRLAQIEREIKLHRAHAIETHSVEAPNHWYEKIRITQEVLKLMTN
jgi:hypothetical protein